MPAGGHSAKAEAGRLQETSHAAALVVGLVGNRRTSRAGCLLSETPLASMTVRRRRVQHQGPRSHGSHRCRREARDASARHACARARGALGAQVLLARDEPGVVVDEPGQLDGRGMAPR